MDKLHGIERLKAIMTRLRDPDGGCPWDVEQSFASIAPYTIEEAYEVADAIERGDMSGLKDELGDLLLQVIYHAEMAREDGAFAFDDVVTAISDKMVRRHPHVFGDATVADSAAQTTAWEQAKACLVQGDNPCVVRSLNGKTRSPKELGLLIETYRALGNTKSARRNMALYVKRYPTARHTPKYQKMLDRK